MLTSFFGKSSPVNYLLLSVFVIIASLSVIFTSAVPVFTGFNIVKYSFVVLGSVFAILLLDFIIRKNHLTQSNTYAIFLFSCFLASLQILFLEPKLLLANVLVMLALRRIFSLASDKNKEKKILDASIFIGFASLLYFPAIGFIIFLLFAILKYVGIQFKMLLIPTVGLLLVFVLTTTFNLVVADSFSWAFDWFQPMSFDFSAYHALEVLIPVTILATILIWTGLHAVYSYPSLAKKERPKTLLLLVLLLISIVITVASPQKSGAEVLFVLPGLAILAANYIGYKKQEALSHDAKTTFWFKELLLWCALLLPLGMLVFF